MTAAWLKFFPYGTAITGYRASIIDVDLWYIP